MDQKSEIQPGSPPESERNRPEKGPVVQDQSQEPPSRIHGSYTGSVGILSDHSWVTWSAFDGHHLEVPIACRPSDANCKPALMYSCMHLEREGLETQNMSK